jgi:glycosyltransferase involved in cell wall biosynthesis
MTNKLTLMVLVDGVFFQLHQTGIGRVWKSLLEEWSSNGFAKYITVIDRACTAPKIAGIRYRDAPPFSYNNFEDDRGILQQICDEEGADLFISSYYTIPIRTPSVFMAYDMIPEVFGGDMNLPQWRQKHDGIYHASAYISISENTAHDLVRFFPAISTESIAIAHCGIKHPFCPAKKEEVSYFKFKYGIIKPYFLLVGYHSSHKNVILFFQAYSSLASSKGFDIIVTGTGGGLSSEYRNYTAGSTVHILQLSDQELSIAYSGALALIYPSMYEGFGMPILEAMACGCPVITCPNSSILEVAGEAAMYIEYNDVNAMAEALCEVQKPNIRQSLITAGLIQATKFSWTKMADIISSALVDASLLYLNLNQHNLIAFPDWNLPQELLTPQIEQIVKLVCTHSDSQKMTLLIEVSDLNSEYAEMILSDVTLNLITQEDLEIAEELNISLVSNLDDIQWSHLLPLIRARIIMKEENQIILSNFMFKDIPAYDFATFACKQFPSHE